MQKLTILHNPRCSKSRTALEALEQAGCRIEIVEYLKDTPSVAELEALVAMLGIQPHDLIRTKEAVYAEHFAGKRLTNKQWIKAIHAYPVLIERPIVIKGKKAYIARSAEQLEAILK